MARNKNTRKTKKLKKIRKEENIKYFLKTGEWIEVNPEKLSSIGCMIQTPKYYKDFYFNCKGCGKPQVWTAKQQQWWYEQAGGKIEQTANRCRACRLKERIRKAEARRIHMKGLAKK